MMAANEGMLGALNEVHGAKKPEDLGLGEWIWGALQGDFNAERSAGQIGFDMVVSLIPLVDTVCDLRDLCANIRQYNKDPGNKVTLFFIATTIVGFVPEIGTVAKSALRLVWVYMRPMIQHADDIANVSKLLAATHRACDAALPKITEYLQHNRVVKWATDGKLPDMYQFVAKTIREAADKLNPAALSGFLNQKIDELRSLLKKIQSIVPSTVREHIDDFIKLIDAKRRAMSDAIQEYVQPVRTVLKVIAKRLDDQAWHVQTYQTNRGWIAPITMTGSAKIINAKPPKWAKDLAKEEMKFPALDLKTEKIKELMETHPNHPQIKKSVTDTFSVNGGGMRPSIITGPAKLYRIIDPTNEGAGMYWMSEKEYKAIRNRDEWRSKFAVRPDWNQNGWVVEYEIKAGETLPVWRGCAASQEIPGTNYFLEGGAEQIVFSPGNRDEMVRAMPRIDKKTGEQLTYNEKPDRRVNYTDVTGETASVGLRARITDPHIRGPVETGWGASDYTPQEARRILLTVPAKS